MTIFLICVWSYNIGVFCFDVLLRNWNKKKDVVVRNKNNSELYKKSRLGIHRAIKITKWVIIVGFLIEVIYSGGFPLFWKITGDSRTYFDFGIASINGALCGLLILIGAYSLAKKSKFFIACIMIGLCLLSRQVIISMLIEGLVIMFLNNSRARLSIRKVLLFGIVGVVLFGVVGNYRSGGDTMNRLFNARNSLSENLPSSVKWIYSYSTFSISNFNNLVSKTNGGKNRGASIFNHVMPTAMKKVLPIQPKEKFNYLVLPNFTVSTYLPEIYLDFGLFGIGVFNFMIGGLGGWLYCKLRKSRKEIWELLYAVFVHNVLLIFFTNMFFNLPTMVQVLYIIVIFYRETEPARNINRISIAMATYNGEKYISQQISSILSQMNSGDELIISDDGSSDNTVKIIKRLKDKRIKLLDGPREGVKRNFENAIAACNGDVIFLADQDDVWMKNKIKVVKKEFEKNPAVSCVVHDAEVFDSDSGLNIYDSFFKWRGSGSGIMKNIYKNTYIGCCMAFDADVKKEILPIPNDIEMHDQWIGVISESNGGSVFVDDILLRYRRHSENVSNMKRHNFRKMVRNRCVFIYDFIRRTK